MIAKRVYPSYIRRREATIALNYVLFTLKISVYEFTWNQLNAIADKEQ